MAQLDGYWVAVGVFCERGVVGEGLGEDATLDGDGRVFADVVEEETFDAALVEDDFLVARDAWDGIGDAVGAADYAMLVGILQWWT